MKIISWNVNGLRAILKKNFMEFLEQERPDILGIQESKLQEHQLPDEAKAPLGYHSYWNYAEKKGYSGTGFFCKAAPKNIKTTFESESLSQEGRVLEIEYDEFTLFNIYFPNGQMNEERLNYKLKFYDESLDYFNSLRAQGKKLVIMGDYNTAHKEIDLKNPKANEENSGFLPIERAWLDKLTASGYVDTFRHFNKEPDQYTWWSYRFKAREKNVGWRIDYFFVTADIVDHLENSYILADIYGSDHCPIGLKLRF
ncbi:MAG: exodeoxyribonuclease III [bacterium]|nr:exodeoxyribonuclease III [bacterium]